MDIALIVGTIATIVVIYIIYRNFFASKGASVLSSQHPATSQQVVSAGKVSGANSSNYSFSIWMFIEDWGYRFGSKKTVFSRGNGALEMYLGKQMNNFVFSTDLLGGPDVPAPAAGDPTLVGCYNDRQTRAMTPFDRGSGKVMTKSACAAAAKSAGMKYMGLQDVNAAGESQCFASSDIAKVEQYGKAASCPNGGGPWINQVFDVEPAGGDSPSTMSASATPAKGQCELENVPLQTWTNVVAVVQDRAVSLYLDGRLVKSCLFTGIPKTIIGSDFYITPDGGFMGYTAGATYYNRALGPGEVYNIYQNGYGGGSIWDSIFGAYGVRVSLVDGGTTVGSVQV
jgi:hypothetical protein